MHTGYYHVVGDVMTYRRGDRFITVKSNIRIVNQFNRNAGYSLLGSYQSKAEAEHSAAAQTAGQEQGK